MDTRRIGSLEVSAIGLGCNNFGGRLDGDQVRAVVGAARDAGITFFDTADIYGGSRSEELLGQALGGARDQVVIATKFGVPYGEAKGGASAAYVHQAVEASLRRLGTDRIDLYQLHFPDDNVPIAETLGALNELVVAGKVREIGCSNFIVEMLEEAGAAVGEGEARFVSVQNQFSILQREPERGVLAECARQGLAFLPYSPLADGLLTGKYRAGEEPPPGSRLAGVPPDRAARSLSDQNLARVEQLQELASQSGHSLLELAVSWLLDHPEVASVIAGATRPEQVRANAAAGSWAIGDDVLAKVDEITAPEAG